MEHPQQRPEPAAEHTTDLSMVDFRAATAQQWRRSVLSGDVSCVELTTTALTAAATMSGLGAFLHVDPEFALARAEQVDSTLTALRRSCGKDQAAAGVAASAPLLGLPTAFKDLVPVAGLPLTRGSLASPTVIPARDHSLARRVHRAGAVSIGKTQVPEFGLPCYSENQLGDPARNPLDLKRTAGGSTGGGGAAVAAGILPLAPGNDGGGSVRIPAAACGLVGLKPGRGRMPDDDASSSVRNLMTSGPIANTAADAALLFDVMAGHRFSPAQTAGGQSAGGSERVQLPLPLGPAQRSVEAALHKGLHPLRIGVTTESPFSPELEIVLAEEAVLALESGISALVGGGHTIQGTDQYSGKEPFWPQSYHQNFQALWTSPLSELDFDDNQMSQLEPLTQYFVELARARPAARTEAAVATLQGLADSAEDIFGPWDVLLTPMLASAAPPIGWFTGLTPEQNYIEQCRFTPYSSVVNVLGLPAINVPVHTDEAGLSWSVQLIGKRGSEVQLLALAASMGA